jgi:hypothetical protein
VTLRILTPAKATKLIPLATVKARLGITTTAQDALLGDLIDEASSAFDTVIGRALARQKYRETAPGSGMQQLRLSQAPVQQYQLAAIDLLSGNAAVDDLALYRPNAGLVYSPGGFMATTPGYGPLEYFADPLATLAAPQYQVDYWAGYIMPDDAPAAWQSAHAYALGVMVRPLTAGVSPLVYLCTTAGNSAASEPAWDSSATIGGTITDGTVTWTIVDAPSLPLALRLLAWQAVKEMYGSIAEEVGVKSLTGEAFTIEYWQGRGQLQLPDAVIEALESDWRLY